jgi:hypothetical protein
MVHSRQALDFDDLDDFDDFQPKQQVPEKPAEQMQKAIDKLSAFPSREQADDSQMNIKASQDILDRFRAMAKAERYRHGEFLEILMNAYEEK